MINEEVAADLADFIQTWAAFMADNVRAFAHLAMLGTPPGSPSHR